VAVDVGSRAACVLVSKSSSDSVVSVVSLCLVSWHCYNILVVWCGGGISFPLCFGVSKLSGSCLDLFCLRVGVVSLKRKEPGRC